MADEQDKWLDRDAAERLLRGEPLEAVDADTQGRAKRLADALGALGALAPEPAPSSAELRGEAAALAAFRQARAGRDGEVAQLGRRGRPGPRRTPPTRGSSGWAVQRRAAEGPVGAVRCVWGSLPRWPPG
ncbi:hypothetical protein OG819_08120 [Streptomyces sp. NBC_01549]|uniref:hypothetical protein n=1 Tax=Streptomyces sp. NBC_01549 TaxID=2975874 RepID=UPI002259F36A|nr:hypothetical protein [Streptomyces sp. NBC_01549]MCX4589724.1 hypothetical protein [Streptomyces sp. NBC_01549]